MSKEETNPKIPKSEEFEEPNKFEDSENSVESEEPEEFKDTGETIQETQELVELQ